MAGTKFAYVRNFELPDAALPDTYMVVRIDGKGFHKFSKAHNFAKPNDPNALELMNAAARHVMHQLKGQAVLAFGESDEYSFLLHRKADLYNRRTSKITTHITSLFTSAYLFHWRHHFPLQPLLYPPSFDGRLVLYPSVQTVRDYFSWRQADTHINNLYNTTFWALVLRGGHSEREATRILSGTVASEKHEVLFKRFGVNYDAEEAVFRKGTVVVWSRVGVRRGGGRGSGSEGEGQGEGEGEGQGTAEVTPEELRRRRKRQVKLAKREERRRKTVLRTLHCDVIGDGFWASGSGEAEGARVGDGKGEEDEPGEEGVGSMGQSSGGEEDHTEVDGEGVGGGGEALDVRYRDRPWLDPRRLDGRGQGAFVFDE